MNMSRLSYADIRRTHCTNFSTFTPAILPIILARNDGCELKMCCARHLYYVGLLEQRILQKAIVRFPKTKSGYQ